MNDSNLLRAIFIVLAGILLLDIMSAFIKVLVLTYPATQLSVFRNLFGMVPSLLILIATREWHEKGRPVYIRQWPLAFSRGLMVVFAQFCFYQALLRMELATATAIVYVSPVIITALSVPILGEKVGRWRWVAVATGFCGMLFIIRPGGEAFSYYDLLPLGAAAGYALSSVTVRRIDRTVSIAMVNLYAQMAAVTGSLILMLSTTTYLPIASMTDWILLLAMGSVGSMGVYCLIAGYRLAKPGDVAPFEYFGLVFAFLIGWIAFNEAPFDTLFPGVLLIVGGGLMIIWRERRQRKINSK